VVAVAILSACFMQEVSGDIPSATPEKPILAEEVKKSAEEVKADEEAVAQAKAFDETQAVAEKLNAKAEELQYKFLNLVEEAAKVGASDEAKKAADQAGNEYEAAEKTPHFTCHKFVNDEFGMRCIDDYGPEADTCEEASELPSLCTASGWPVCCQGRESGGQKCTGEWWYKAGQKCSDLHSGAAYFEPCGASDLVV